MAYPPQPPPHPGQPYPMYPQQPPRPPKSGPGAATWLLLIVLGLFVLLCGGCAVSVLNSASDSDDERTTTTTRSTSAVAAPPPARTTPRAASSTPNAFSDDQTAELAFFLVLDQRGIKYSSKQAMIDLATAVCDARKAGNGNTAIALEIAAQGYSASDAGYIVGASESAYCPQYK